MICESLPAVTVLFLGFGRKNNVKIREGCRSFGMTAVELTAFKKKKKASREFVIQMGESHFLAVLVS